MKARKVLSVVFLVCGLLFLSLFAVSCGNSDRSKDLPQKAKDKVVTATHEYPASSAIKKAKEEGTSVDEAVMEAAHG